jgi:hypothetical protein
MLGKGMIDFLKVWKNLKKFGLFVAVYRIGQKALKIDYT